VHPIGATMPMSMGLISANGVISSPLRRSARCGATSRWRPSPWSIAANSGKTACNPHTAILSAVIFNATIIVLMIPLALRDVRVTAAGTAGQRCTTLRPARPMLAPNTSSLQK
jgi:hypothetical protein